MSFTSYQQVKIDKMLTFSNDFKKLYWRIPKEFVHNYYYEMFLFHTADISSNIELAQQYSKTKNGHDIGLDMKFDVKKTDNGVTSLLKYIENDNKGRCMSKRIMKITLDNKKSLSFHQEVDLWYFDKEHKDPNSLSTYDLTMKLSDDKSLVYVTLSWLRYRDNVPFLSTLSSVFLPDGEEISRIIEGVNLETQGVCFKEELFPIGTVDSSILKTYQKKGEEIPFSFLNLSTSNTTQDANHSQHQQEVYLGKSTKDGNSRFAICFKPDDFVNQQYQKSFESVSSFFSFGYDLVEKLDSPNHPLLIEVSGYDYQKIIGTQKEKSLQFRKK